MPHGRTASVAPAANPGCVHIALVFHALWSWQHWNHSAQNCYAHAPSSQPGTLLECREKGTHHHSHGKIIGPQESHMKSKGDRNHRQAGLDACSVCGCSLSRCECRCIFSAEQPSMDCHPSQTLWHAYPPLVGHYAWLPLAVERAHCLQRHHDYMAWLGNCMEG